MKQSMQVLTSSATDEWYTPAFIIARVKRVLGKIDLDPASCIEANEIVGAEVIYTDAIDGLNCPWYGRVFLNPPYGKTGTRSNQEIWGEKLIEWYYRGVVKEAILLCKAVPGYDWFDSTWDCVDATCWVRGLVRFHKPGVGEVGKAKAGTVLFYFSPNPEKFKEVFSEIGRVYIENGDN